MAEKITRIFGVDRPAVDEPPPLIYCMGCKHWQQQFGSPFGQCLISGKFLSAPMVTTDLSTCTRAEVRT